MHEPGTYMEEVEFSNKWVAEHPILFSERFLAFVEQHPAPYWGLSMSATGHFFTVRAAKVEAA